MQLIQPINIYDFHDAFRGSSYENNFTYEGRIALFNYLEELEFSTDNQTELDIVALCCDYSEYKNIEEVKGDYPDIEDLEDLQEHTQVIVFDEGLIIQCY